MTARRIHRILTLHVLGCSGMETMTGGMMAAHAAHAARHADVEIRVGGRFQAMVDDYGKWALQTPQGFGTVLTLDTGNLVDMREMVDKAVAAGLAGAVIHDPDYPILREGDVTHAVATDTCGWVFGLQDEVADVIGVLPYYP